MVVSCTFSSFSSVVARRLASEIFFWKPVKISQNYVREFVASLLWSILYISPARLSQTGSECGSRSDAVIYHSPVTLSGRQYFVTKWPSSRGDVDYLGLRLQPTLMDIAIQRSPLGSWDYRVARSSVFYGRSRISAPVPRLPEGSRPGDRISRIGL